MYGYCAPEELVGARLRDLLPSSVLKNVEYFKSFVRSKYRLNDAESQEVDRQGNTKYFSKRICPYLVRVLWDPCYPFAAFSRSSYTRKKPLKLVAFSIGNPLKREAGCQRSPGKTLRE
jgi:hypothetical protein